MAILNHSNAIEIFGRNRFVFHADETSLSTVEELLQALCLPIFGKAMPNALLALEEMAASSEALVLLDNFESVWERERDVAEKFLRLLTETQGLAILMTIRGSELPRGVSWNKWVELPPLAPEQSEEFFRTIAPDVPKGDSNFDELLSDLDGLPLAIELLAERARFTPFDELFNRWQRHKLKLLSREPQLSRSDSLTLSISFTVAGPRITSSGFHLFAIMGRLPAGILVADCDKIFGEESIDMIYELRRTRLVFDEAERLKMLNPIREYALQLPVDEQRFERTRKYYFALLHLHGPAPGNLDIAGGIRRLTPEIGNVSRLMADNSDFADDELATEYIERFANFGRFSGISSIETLASVAENAGSQQCMTVRARALLKAGEVALHHGRLENAKDLITACTPLFGELDEPISDATCVKMLGDIEFARDNYLEAQEKYRAAIKLYEGAKSPLGVANCKFQLAEISLLEGDDDQAFLQNRNAYREYKAMPGLELGTAGCVLTFAKIALRRSKFLQAERLAARSLKSHRDKLGDKEGEGRSLLVLAHSKLAQNDVSAASDCITSAHKAFRDLGNPYWIGIALYEMCLLSDLEKQERLRDEAIRSWKFVDRLDLVAKISLNPPARIQYR